MLQPDATIAKCAPCGPFTALDSPSAIVSFIPFYPSMLNRGRHGVVAARQVPLERGWVIVPLICDWYKYDSTTNQNQPPPETKPYAWLLPSEFALRHRKRVLRRFDVIALSRPFLSETPFAGTS
jgi:hypothetical protein